MNEERAKLVYRGEEWDATYDLSISIDLPSPSSGSYPDRRKLYRNRWGEFDRTKTFPNGKTIQHQGVINRQGNGNYTGTIDPTGAQQTYQVNGKVQRNDRTITNSGTITNQQGQVGTFDRSRSCRDRTCKGNSIYATPKGNVYTSCQNGSCSKNGVITRQAKVNTIANRTVQGTYTIDRGVIFHSRISSIQSFQTHLGSMHSIGSWSDYRTLPLQSS